METTDWFPIEQPPHYDGWYEAIYENSQQVVMRWYDVKSGDWFLDDHATKQACFGWAGDRWRGLTSKAYLSIPLD